MTDLTHLIGRLRELADYAERREMEINTETLRQAADALQSLTARVGELEGARARAFEEAAVIAETWFDNHRPKQPEKSRFDIYDIQRWAKTATLLVAEDIRARALNPVERE